MARFKSRKFLFFLAAFLIVAVIATVGVFTLKPNGESYISDNVWLAAFTFLLGLPITYGLINIKQKKLYTYTEESNGESISCIDNRGRDNSKRIGTD